MKLENGVPWGRSLTEYQAMLALSEGDLQKRILGCGDGPASFNAEMTYSGRQTVTSVDPLYAYNLPDIARRIAETEHGFFHCATSTMSVRSTSRLFVTIFKRIDLRTNWSR